MPSAEVATDVPLIFEKPGCCAGAARVRQMRIPVWLLVAYKQLGLTENQFFENWPSLTKNDLAAAWRYYALHREEIDEEIRLNDEDEDDEDDPTVHTFRG